jgi:hypothetical protein
MRNAVTLGVSHNRLDVFRREFELFRDFGNAHAIVEVIDNCVDRHPRASEHRNAAAQLADWTIGRRLTTQCHLVYWESFTIQNILNGLRF